MHNWDNIPEPFNLNPLKHHLGYIRSFTSECSILSEEEIIKDIVPALRHIGTSVADIYTGSLHLEEIVSELNLLRKQEDILSQKSFMEWIAQSKKDYRKFRLSDSSLWVLKYLDDKQRYFHIFPGRNIELTARSRGNSLKTAILYTILYDKGDILFSDLNSVRKMLALSPLRNIESASSIITGIRMLQSG
ncbi:MAG TPA: hypothetical protein ENH59_06325 [Bacteroidetes bacterium]|nr:hypothetical protein [Bacteroidota bacterium]